MKQLWSNLSYYVNLFKEEFKQKKKNPLSGQLMVQLTFETLTFKT